MPERISKSESIGCPASRCSECRRLLAEYARLARAYTIAFDAAVKASSRSQAEFAMMKAAADAANRESKEARLELEWHRRTHAGNAGNQGFKETAGHN